MAIDIAPVLVRLRSHAAACGLFRIVYGHEPKTTPVAGSDLAAAFWLQSIEPYSNMSGLSETAALVRVTCRLYALAQSEPADAIDDAMAMAVVKLMEIYNGDFELAGTATAIDVMRMTAEAGYIEYDDGSAKLRVFTITIPIRFSSAWAQAA